MCFRFDVDVLDGRFSAEFSKPTGWNHIVLNYIGPDNGQGIRIYINGAQVESVTTKNGVPYSAGDGRMVLGRESTNEDARYASMEIDELIFFNKALSTTDIERLYNAV